MQINAATGNEVCVLGPVNMVWHYTLLLKIYFLFKGPFSENLSEFFLPRLDALSYSLVVTIFIGNQLY